MRARTRTAVIAIAASLTLLGATACQSGNTPTAPVSGGEITRRGCTPQEALLPGTTNETCGGDILDGINSKLVKYNPQTAAPEMDIAESITSEDNQNFKVKLKQGYKFHDGTEVKAKNFVDAWNWAAHGPNGAANGYFMQVIAGWADLQCGKKDEEADCASQPAKADKMTGLVVVDDYNFTIKTTDQVSNLSTRLGYTAFSPLPDAFFAASDKDAWAKNPIGTGPFKFDKSDDKETVLSKFADYKGTNPAKVDKVTFRIYNSTDTAYNDVLANNLDFTDVIPNDRLLGDRYKTELTNRNGVKDSLIIQFAGFTPADARLKNVGVRKAISMAIDRQTITQKLFNGTRTPAAGWVPSSVDGYKADQCGEACVFDATKAKQLLESSGGFQGILQFGYNEDGGHKPWVEAACNQIKNALGIDCRPKGYPKFANLLDDLDAGKLTGIFRLGWQADYPSIENFLTPMYAKDADSNYAKYNNPAFEDLLRRAGAAKSPADANALYQQAEALLTEALPTMPLWFTSTPYGYSTKVTNVNLTPFGTLDMSAITVTGK